MEQRNIKQFGKNVYTVWKWFIWGLRWLSIILFGMLFFIGIYFKLPWKVLACIALIPVVGIFVPRKIQPWIWGGMTLFIAALWGWVKLPEHSSKSWKPYEYTEELAAIENGSMPADVNNAADLYSAVFDQYGEDIFYFRSRSTQAEEITFSSPWDPNEYPVLNFWISKFDPAIEQLIEASRIEQCRFDIPHNLASLTPQMQRVNQIKGWIRLLIRSANRDLFMNNQSAALEKLLAIPAIAQHLYQQQTLFDQSAAFHIELLGARALEMFIIDHCDNPEQFTEIESAFVNLNPQWARSWKGILLREKLVVKNLAALMYEVDDTGRIRVSHDAMMALQAGLGFQPQRLFLNQHEMNRLAVIGLWLWLPSNPKRLARMVDERFDDYSLQVQKGEKIPQYPLTYVWIKGLNAQSVVDWLAMQQVGYFWALDGQFKQHEAIEKQIRIFTALKKYWLVHQCWPQRLDELAIEDVSIFTDPVCGKSFVYEQTSQGFRLYSLGTNGIDDGGINNLKQNKDDILLWPRNQFDSNEDVEKTEMME